MSLVTSRLLVAEGRVEREDEHAEVPIVHLIASRLIDRSDHRDVDQRRRPRRQAWQIPGHLRRELPPPGAEQRPRVNSGVPFSTAGAASGSP